MNFKSISTQDTFIYGALNYGAVTPRHISDGWHWIRFGVFALNIYAKYWKFTWYENPVLDIAIIYVCVSLIKLFSAFKNWPIKNDLQLWNSWHVFNAFFQQFTNGTLCNFPFYFSFLWLRVFYVVCKELQHYTKTCKIIDASGLLKNRNRS